MLASSINSFRLKAATVQDAALGVDITFRGVTVKARLSGIRVGIELDTGGRSASGEQTARILQASLATPPARGEQMTINGRKYTVDELKDAISTPGEYVVILQTGSKL
jgi:hypothetical protein